MKPTFMFESHQNPSSFAWPLARDQAVTLAAHGDARSLWVHEGRVWLTRQCAAGTPEDVWLEAGQSQLLPAGTEWVAEAWPLARVSVVQAAQTVIKPHTMSAWTLPWRRLTPGGRNAARLQG